MTMKPAMNRTFKFMTVVFLLAILGSFFYEYNFVRSGTPTMGEIVAFQKKAFNSAQGDPVEMVVVYSVSGEQRKFYSGRNVFEQVFGTYGVGDSVPVVYNPDSYPGAKIGNLQHLYGITLMLVIMWLLFSVVLLFVQWKMARKAAGSS